MSQETVAAQDMLARFAQWQGRAPVSVAVDTTYGNGEFLQWLLERDITPYMRTRDSVHRKNSPFYGPERFTYLPESNSYRCHCFCLCPPVLFATCSYSLAAVAERSPTQRSAAEAAPHPSFNLLKWGALP